MKINTSDGRTDISLTRRETQGLLHYLIEATPATEVLCDEEVMDIAEFRLGQAVADKIRDGLPRLITAEDVEEVRRSITSVTEGTK